MDLSTEYNDCYTYLVDKGCPLPAPGETFSDWSSDENE